MDENYCSKHKENFVEKMLYGFLYMRYKKNSGVIVRMSALFTYSIVGFFSSNQGWVTKKTKQKIYILLTRVLGR